MKKSIVWICVGFLTAGSLYANEGLALRTAILQSNVALVGQGSYVLGKYLGLDSNGSKRIAVLEVNSSKALSEIKNFRVNGQTVTDIGSSSQAHVDTELQKGENFAAAMAQERGAAEVYFGEKTIIANAIRNVPNNCTIEVDVLDKDGRLVDISIKDMCKTVVDRRIKRENKN